MTQMSNETVLTPGGCLGRVLTWVGSAWLALIIIAGLGAFRGSPLDEIVSIVGASLVPAVLLIAAGTALRRRQKAVERQAEPVVVPRRPQGPRRPPPPAPVKKPAPRAPEPPAYGVPEPDQDDLRERLESGAEDEFDPASHPMFDFDFGIGAGGMPKTSKEMIEEAKRRLREQDPPN